MQITWYEGMRIPIRDLDLEMFDDGTAVGGGFEAGEVRRVGEGVVLGAGCGGHDA